MDIVAPKGLTLWFNQPLKGNVRISYEARMIMETGKFDRLSDLNCFWMANDPMNPEDFFRRSDWRKGVFGKYYSLRLYYVGYGGNDNSTTRFRRYDGDYESYLNGKMRPDLVKEYTDPTHLLVPNKWCTIEIVVKKNNTKFIFNNETLVDYTDPQPYTHGYFGFRLVRNHVQIKNFKVVKL